MPVNQMAFVLGRIARLLSPNIVLPIVPKRRRRSATGSLCTRKSLVPARHGGGGTHALRAIAAVAVMASCLRAAVR